MNIRTAQPDDAVTTLWPEFTDHQMNLDQVFVAVDDDGTLLGGTVMFHGGHSVAYSGSTRIVESEQKGLVAYHLFTFLQAWCRAHGITLLGHGARDGACQKTLTTLGATVRCQYLLMELMIPCERKGVAHG